MPAPWWFPALWCASVRVADAPHEAPLSPVAPPGTAAARLSSLVWPRLIPSGSSGPPWHSAVVTVDPDADRMAPLPGLRFSDGQRVTAADLCASVDAAMAPHAPAWLRGPVAARVAGCRIVDGWAVLERRDPARAPWPALDLPLVPADDASKLWSRLPGQPLPPGAGGRVAPRADGWQVLDAPGAPRHLRWTTPERAAAAVDLHLGALDGWLSPTGDWTGWLKTDAGVRLVWHRATVGWGIAFDTRAGPLGDARVRDALALALSPEALRPAIDGEDPSAGAPNLPPWTGPFPIGSPWHRARRPTDARDPGDLLREAGYLQTPDGWARDGGLLTIRLGAPDGHDLPTDAALQAVAAGWTTLGVVVVPVRLSAHGATRLADGADLGVDATWWPWPLLPDGPSGPAAGDPWSNPFRWDPPELAALRARAASPDPVERDAAAWAITALVDVERPFVPLWQLDHWTAWRAEAAPDALARGSVWSPPTHAPPPLIDFRRDRRRP